MKPTLLLALLFACNAPTEDACTSVWFLDADNDGFGGTDQLTACDAPSGYVALSTDCDDGNGDVFPGADEHCDGVDNDCDGDLDEEAVDGVQVYADNDSDGYGDANESTVTCQVTPGWVEDSHDCDDGNAEAHPFAYEICDGADNDCDGTVDAPTWPADFSGTLTEAVADTSGLLCVQPGEHEVSLQITGNAILSGFGEDETVLVPAAGSTGPALVVSGVPYASISRMRVEGVSVANSQGVVFQDMYIGGIVDTAAAGCDGCVLDIQDSNVTMDRVDVRDNQIDITMGSLPALGPVRVTRSDLSWIEGAYENNALTISGGSRITQALFFNSFDSTVYLQRLTLQNNTFDQTNVALQGVTSASARGFFNVNKTTIDLERVNVLNNTLSAKAHQISGGNASTESIVFLNGQNASDIRWFNSALQGNDSIAYANTETDHRLFRVDYSSLELTDVDIYENAMTSETDFGPADVGGIMTTHSTNRVVRVDFRDNEMTAKGPNGLMSGMLETVDSDDTEIANVVFAGNSLLAENQYMYGLLMVVRSDADIRNLTVFSNDLEARSVTAPIWLGGVNGSFANSAIHDNTVTSDNAHRGAAAAMRLTGATLLSVAYNGFSGNTSNQAGDVWGDNASVTLIGTDHNISAAHAFADTSGDPVDWDLSPASGSDLIDAGDPAIEDNDGSTCDIGAWGGPDAF